DAVLQPGEERDVDEPPAQPAYESGEFHGTGLQQRVPPADVSRGAEVTVPVGPTGRAFEIVTDAGGGVHATLHRVLGNARQVVTAGKVADDKDLGMACHGQVGFHRDPPRAVGVCAQNLGDASCEGHGLDTGRPQDRPRRVLLGRAAGLWYGGHAVETNVGDMHTHVELDAQFLQDPGGLVGKVWRETAEDAAASVEEQHPRVFGFDAVELLGQSSSSHFSDL